jgi:hypothetical protein
MQNVCRCSIKRFTYGWCCVYIKWESLEALVAKSPGGEKRQGISPRATFPSRYMGPQQHAITYRTPPHPLTPSPHPPEASREPNQLYECVLQTWQMQYDQCTY